MRFSSTLLAVLLLAVVATAPMSSQVPTIAAPAPARPTGCHDHGQPAPDPAPRDYKCCQAGHQTALLQGSFVSSSVLLHTLSIELQPLPVSTWQNASGKRQFVFASPPGATILRI